MNIHVEALVHRLGHNTVIFIHTISKLMTLPVNLIVLMAMDTSKIKSENNLRRSDEQPC